MTRKTGKEAKAERITWFAMVSVFLFLSFDSTASLAGYAVCLILGAILIISGFYQYSQKWRVSPMTWMGGALLLLIGTLGFSYGYLIPVDLTLVGLLLTIAIILGGVVTNEG